MSLKQVLRVLTVVVLLHSTNSFGHIDATIGGVNLDSNPNLAFDVPDTQNSEVIISRDQYVISYNKEHRSPNWVAWKLEADQIGSSGRSNGFALDQELEDYLLKNTGYHAVGPNDYRNSCFDRGHQCPSGDRTDSPGNNLTTFMMSNMIPQTPYLNQVIWEHLEQYTRDMVQKNGKKAFVIAGPIYDINLGQIGPNSDIPVPSKDFKIVFFIDANQTVSKIKDETPSIVVIMPNILKNGHNPVASTPNCEGGIDSADVANVNDWQVYKTTVSDVEAKSGLKFHF